ncbi:hypothetical protein PPYR_08293 [Photinus pyralis]|uniref:ETS domain-containing protein n=1 Tax=Photinus pyralis TaxID=7054 RepID=A0A5N4AJ25_PHOPY|nr:ETS homologous factor-like [Photinus pyralis]KAB0797299.1 hypothetical protein PPYR_08293 [Photinus pyralis]
MSVLCELVESLYDNCHMEKGYTGMNGVNSSWTIDQIRQWLKEDSPVYVNITTSRTTESSSISSRSQLGLALERNQQKRKRDRNPGTDVNRRRPYSFGKLWEFLRDLLHDRSTCPSLIKWHNYGEGTFKFVQGAKVAKLWGSRNNNKNMSYDKLSRAMRYHYGNKVLLPVQGQRLVYKFGPNAIGWQTDSPILN